MLSAMKKPSQIAIKFCGITRPEDAEIACNLGVDALGLVFWKKSKRSLCDLGRAAEVAAASYPLTTLTGLFVDADPAWIDSVCARIPLNILQFHGSETPEYCSQFQRPFLRALRMKEGLDLQTESERFDSARGLLLDTYVSGSPGGTGEAFDWTRFPQTPNTRFVLAGGLNPSNVARAISVSGAQAVDVSGGIESAPGVKSAEQMRDFVCEVEVARRARE